MKNINKIILLVLIFTLIFTLSACKNTAKSGELAVYSTKNTQNAQKEVDNNDNQNATACAVGDSKVVTFFAYPIDSCQDCIWSLTLDESKMNSWLFNRVKDSLSKGKKYIDLQVDKNKATVTAIEYFKYGIKYKTYWILTATSTENGNLSASCSISLG